ncbi:MAG TPA: hypothetical protein VMW74_05490, partial [Nitrosopumilaceae archaeon]|nr:hypothetical protein [Nitrosopumilaceae archaeon]
MIGKVVVNTGDSFTSQPTPNLTEPTLPTTPESLPPDPKPAPESAPESIVAEVTIPQGAALQTVEEYYLPSNISINTADTIIWENQDDAF